MIHESDNAHMRLVLGGVQWYHLAMLAVSCSMCGRMAAMGHSYWLLICSSAGLFFEK
jgi:hypothetical protein